MKKSALTILVLQILFIQVDIKADIINVPQDQPGIQQAIDAASSLDTILLEPGEYFEHIYWLGKSLTIGSHYLLTGDTTFISQTIINGGEAGRVFDIVNVDAPASINGLVITKGKARDGAGIRTDSSVISLNHVWIIDCYASGLDASVGAGIYAWMSELYANHFRIDSNLTVCANDNSEGAAICSVHSNLYLNNGHIGYNTADLGGGIFQHLGESQITNVDFNNNTSYYPGGALAMFSNESVEIKRSRFSGNDGYGSVLYADGTQTLNITNCLFTGNGAMSMHLENLLIKLINCTFADNIGPTAPIWAFSNTSIYAMNTIFYNGLDAEFEVNNDVELYFGHCAITNGLEGINGNPSINTFGPIWEEAPLYAGNGSYKLSDYSQYIGSGLDSLETFPHLKAPLFDMENNPRPMPEGSMPDVGAYENELGNPLLAIHENELNTFDIYPNPARDRFAVGSSLFVERNCVIQVFGLFGRKVKEIKVPNGEEQITINVEGWQGGLYLVKVSSEDGNTESVKVIIE